MHGRCPGSESRGDHPFRIHLRRDVMAPFIPPVERGRLNSPSTMNPLQNKVVTPVAMRLQRQKDMKKRAQAADNQMLECDHEFPGSP